MRITRWLWWLLIVVLAGCGTNPSDSQATQTPILVIVTGVTPQQTFDEPTATLLPSAFPTPFICSGQFVEQPFEYGRMFWVGKTLDERCQEVHDFTPGSGEIWVAIFDASGEAGVWFIFDDEWNEETDIPFDLTMTQPAGLLQPVRGFGKVWREALSDEQRADLGWATYEEVGYVTDYRYDAGGFIDDQGEYVPRPGQHSLTTLTGERFFLDEQTGQFEYVSN